ncbi:hypothetical protein DBR06_SOUSAS910012, partial [Sousa chinensis]
NWRPDNLTQTWYSLTLPCSFVMNSEGDKPCQKEGIIERHREYLFNHNTE